LHSHAVHALRGVDRHFLVPHIEFGAREGQIFPLVSRLRRRSQNLIGLADHKKSTFLKIQRGAMFKKLSIA
jgi:hypothetical protein